MDKDADGRITEEEAKEVKTYSWFEYNVLRKTWTNLAFAFPLNHELAFAYVGLI